LIGNTTYKAVAVTEENQQLEAFFSIFFLSLFFAYPLSTFLSKYLLPSSNIISVLARTWVLILGLKAIHLNMKWKKGLYGLPFLLFLFFWCIYCVRIAHDTLLSADELGSSPALYFNFAILLSFITSIGCFTKVAFWKWRHFHKSLLVILVSLNALIFISVITAPTDYIIERGFRFEGNERLNPITSGMIAAFLLVFIFVKVYNGQITAKSAWFYLLLAALSGVNLVTTLSKGPILFAVLSMLLVLLRLVSKGAIKKLLVIAMGVLGIAAIMNYFGIVDIVGLVLERFIGIGERDDSTAERLMLYNNAWKQFLSSPLTGDFLEERILRIYPHNMILESLMALGIFGGLLFMLYYFISGLRLATVLLRTNVHIVSLIIFYGFISSMISGSLSMGPEIWYCFAFAHVFYYQYTLKKQQLLPVQNHISDT